MNNATENNDKAKENAEELARKIKEMLPAEAGFVRIEFEGPDIVVVLKNSKVVYADENIVRNIAASIKKKLIMRSDKDSLMKVEERPRRS